MFVVAEMDTAVLDFFLREAVEHTFGNHGSAIVDAHDFALDDTGNHHVDDLLDGDFGFVEELGDDDHRVVASSGNAQCKVAGTAAHGRNHKPVLRGAGILHNSTADDGALRFGTVVAEGGGTVGQRQVVVDGFGHMDIGNGVLLIGQEFGYAVGRRSGVVATHGNKQLDVVVGEKG